MTDMPFPDLPLECQGPKMQALRDDRRRRFAYIMACGQTSAAEAARAAGYSDSSGSDKVQAHHLMHDQTVLDAIHEAGKKVLLGLAPLAVKVAKEILLNPDDKGRARMVEVIFDRTGYVARTEHAVTVTHTADVKELEALARRLALENGIAPERFLGVNGLDGGSKTIEHLPTVKEVNPVSRETNEDLNGISKDDVCNSPLVSQPQSGE